MKRLLRLTFRTTAILAFFIATAVFFTGRDPRQRFGRWLIVLHNDSDKQQFVLIKPDGSIFEYGYGTLFVIFRLYFFFWLACELTPPLLKHLRAERCLSKPHFCTTCDYNLTGNVSGICPECGSKIDQASR